MNTMVHEVAPDIEHAAARAVYLAAIGRSSDLQGFNEAGLDALQRCRVVHVGPLSAVVIDVPLHQFTGEDAERRLADVGWIAPRASRHEAILQAARLKGPILPARFATLFSSELSLCRSIERHADDVMPFLQRVESADEWTIKIYAEKEKAIDERVHEMMRAPGAARSAGAQYLMRQRLRRDAEVDLAPWLEKHATEAIAPLVDRAIDCKRQRCGAAEDGLMPVLSLALLVDRSHAADLRSAASAVTYARGGTMDIRLAGPWPVYSFCPSLRD